MTDLGHEQRAGTDLAPRAGPLSRLAQRVTDWRLAQVSSPAFQRWAAGFWLTRPFVRRDTERLYDLVAGFVYSQTLLACVELGVLERLSRGPMYPDALAPAIGTSEDRAERLCQAAASVGLVVRRRDGTYRLGRLGAAVLGVPGLGDMIRHHKVFYRDMADPVALLRDGTETELSRFWPYVLGTAEGEIDPATARTYSDLMATSQHLVAEETLDAISLRGVEQLCDIGGGTGVFLQHVAERYGDLSLRLFDLPPVAVAAVSRLKQAGLSDRIRVSGGSFIDGTLPSGADAISLIRVCYDHDDATVAALLRRIRAVLPDGGRLIISEPMSGGERPSRAGDAYFGFYTLAMTTGRPRSAARHAALLEQAGFRNIRQISTRRPFLTSVISAVR